MKSKYGFETTEKRSSLMSKIKSTETQVEVLLRKKLWSKGIRYRKNNKDILGCPDISIKKYKIAIFIDGEFWHGFNWREKKKKIKSNRKYWIEKIEGNMQRDEKTDKNLKKQGWCVIRLWEHEIKKDINSCFRKINKKISNNALQRTFTRRHSASGKNR